MKKELSYSFIMYGMGDPVACENNIGYWYGICLSHIHLRTQRNARQETALTWQLFMEDLTSLVELLDACPNKLIRDSVHMLWSRWMLISKGRSRKVEIFMLLNCMY
jgi:hypothetical protein